MEACLEVVRHPLFLTFMIIMIVDGFKLMIEVAFCKKEKVFYKGKPEDVTIVVAAYNEAKTIAKTIESLIKIVPVGNIIIADDGSKDGTSDAVRNYNSDVLVLSDKNKGKVGAIHRVLSHVKTPYVLLMDADTILEENFIIPTEALEKGDATAVAFNIATTSCGKSYFSRLLLHFQSHEYSKSTQIGKRFSNPTKSVHCISGAIGLFKTERLIMLSKEHTTIFQGEDLERTLLELVADGNVIFSESTVYTDVPATFGQLTKQRIIGWWPGLWRNLYLFLKLIVKRKVPIRLRYELLYEIFAVVTTPFKIISLAALFLTCNWMTLFFIFLTYLVLECIVYFRIKKLIGKYMKMDFLVVSLYPFYAILQMFYVAISFFVFLYKKFLTKDWVKVASFVLVSILPFNLKAQSDSLKHKKDFTLDLKYARILDSEGGRTFNNYEAYLGYKNLFASVTTSPYNAVSLGGYFGPFFTNVRYQFESKTLAARLQYEKWFGNYAPYAFVGYGTSEFNNSVNSTSFFTTGLGVNYYFENQSSVGVLATKEFARDYGMTFVAKAKVVSKNNWFLFGASMTNFGDPGAFAQVGYKMFYIHGDYYKNFDFTNFNRTSFGVGLKFKF